MFFPTWFWLVNAWSSSVSETWGATSAMWRWYYAFEQQRKDNIFQTVKIVWIFDFIFIDIIKNVITLQRSLPFLSFIVLICVWNFPLVSIIFLKRSLVFPILCLPLFLCIVHWIRPYQSLLFSGALCSVGFIVPFLPCFLLLFFPQLFVKPPQTTTLPSCIFFSFGKILVTASCTMLWTSVHGSLGTQSSRCNPLNLFITSTV